jgi:hypothetical protein
VVRFLLLAATLAIHALHEIFLFAIVLSDYLAYASFLGDIQPLINVVEILTPPFIHLHFVLCRVLHVTNESAVLLLVFVPVVFLGLQGVELPPRMLLDDP